MCCPSGVLLLWLTTRPVIENKRLPELVSSQLRYLAEPKTFCRMAPFAEKDHIALSARVWRRDPARARAKKAGQVPGASQAPRDRTARRWDDRPPELLGPRRRPQPGRQQPGGGRCSPGGIRRSRSRAQSQPLQP